jgi:DNA-binding transcriptional MerR regulator
MRVYADGVSTGYKIKDIADRSGFSAATLRYYEDVGLLPAPVRSASGYRLYDDATLDRLAFIARAKQLGCSLHEIADLATAWEGGRCGPVQDRLRRVVADKFADSQRQIAELLMLSSELQRAAASLELHRPEGPCDDECGCVITARSEHIALALTSKPGSGDVIACSLGTDSMAGRLDEWRALLSHVVAREHIDGGVRATFATLAPLDELMRLAAAEHDCCRFFSFAITVDARGIALEVRAAPDALPIVHTLFGVPA